MRIVVFGRETCASCPQLRRVLKNNNVDFEYRNAEGQEYDSIAAMYGGSVPLTVDMTTGRGVATSDARAVMRLFSLGDYSHS